MVPITETPFRNMVEYATSFSLAVIRTLAHRLRKANAQSRRGA